MAKIKTLQKQKASLKKQRLHINPDAGVIEHNPLDYLLNEDNIARGVLECLKNNDPEGVVEILKMYINALNASHLSRKTNLPRSTIYNCFKHKNPTIKTLAKMVSSNSLELVRRK